MVEDVAVRCEALSVRYRKSLALADVSFKAQRGERVAVLGHNGSGRSSLLKAIAGLAPASGRIELNGECIDTMPAHSRIRNGVSMVMEGAGFLGTLTVDEHLRLFARASIGRGDERPESIYSVFPRLAERRHVLSRNLSGGERQMLKIGSALLQAPVLLLLDEPTAGLAPRIALDLAQQMRQLCIDRGITAILAEQSPEFARRFADRVLVLKAGRVAFDRPIDESSYFNVLQAMGLAVEGQRAIG